MDYLREFAFHFPALSIVNQEAWNVRLCHRTIYKGIVFQPISVRCPVAFRCYCAERKVD